MLIDRPHHPVPVRAQPIAHRQQFGFGRDVERDVLHDTRSDRAGRVAGVRYAELRVDVAHLRSLDQSDRVTHLMQPSLRVQIALVERGIAEGKLRPIDGGDGKRESAGRKRR
jgi:hypothetical protein